MFDPFPVTLTLAETPTTGAGQSPAAGNDTAKTNATTQPASGTGGTGGGGGGGAGTMIQMVLLAGMVIVFLFFVSNGNRKEKKRRQQLLEALKKGDKVTTIGGEIGTVVEVRDNEVTLKVDESSNTRIKYRKSAIDAVITEAAPDSK